MTRSTQRGPTPPGPGEPGPLERARTCCERRAWADAFAALSQADQLSPLGPEDLERLVLAASLAGHEEAMLPAQERLYHLQLEAGDGLAAARTAFWLGFRLFARGEAGRAGGWLGRAQRLVEKEPQDCVERGYLMLPAGQRLLSLGEASQAHDLAARAAEIGERFGEADLVAFARNLQGRALLREGRLDRGLALVDEAMVAVTSDELSPVVTGLIYCSAIASCQRVYALDRAREWTAALARWCDAQPQLVLFTGSCLVHRAEILQIGGSWPEAIEEARRAGEQCLRGAFDAEAAGRACYQQAEIHRLRGELAAAEEAYRQASQKGVEPQPGLALLRLAEGDAEAAAAAIRRVVAATNDPLQRTRLLPALVEILLAVRDLEGARAAARELEGTASVFQTEVLSAIAWHAAGAVQLAEGNPGAVLEPVRRAFGVWQQVGAPYLAARLRVLLARACLALEDTEGARLELEAARPVFERLGARLDLDALSALQARVAPRRRSALPGGLTERELQVLRLVASGKTNRVIAGELSLSEKTVDRHLSNIFTKIDVSSRAAATAYAYEHDLV
jgi:ATP/maltotriose-dependent transcriptional regulator MalT